MLHLYFFFFFFNDTATTEIYTLSLHDALPIFLQLQPRLRQQYQVICIKQFPWQAFLEIVSYGLHYYVEQDWAKYRPLVYPHLDLKTFTLFTIPFDRCRNSIIHTFNAIYHPLSHSNMPQSPPQNLMWHSVEGFLQVHKRHPQLLLFAKELFLNLSYNKDKASVIRTHKNLPVSQKQKKSI